MDAESVRIGEPGTLTMPDVLWDRTKSISAVIAPLAAQAIVGRAAVEAAASWLGVSRRQVYVLIKPQLFPRFGSANTGPYRQ